MGGRLARKGRPLGKARTRSLALMPNCGCPGWVCKLVISGPSEQPSSGPLVALSGAGVPVRQG